MCHGGGSPYFIIPDLPAAHGKSVLWIVPLESNMNDVENLIRGVVVQDCRKRISSRYHNAAEAIRVVSPFGSQSTVSQGNHMTIGDGGLTFEV